MSADTEIESFLRRQLDSVFATHVALPRHDRRRFDLVRVVFYSSRTTVVM